MIKLDNIRLKPDYTEDNLKTEIAKNLKISKTEILCFEIIKKSIDARRKPDVKIVLSVGIKLKNEDQFVNLKFEPDYSLFEYDKKFISDRPVVVGFGPSGMFLSLMLARMGLKPIVIEQGERVEERIKTVEKFWNERKLNEFSNVQFGEGGAGTFSDGKLNTNLNSIYCKKVINEFYHYGAPKEILYVAKPHIGTDNLRGIVKNIREEIIRLGGEIKFSTKLVDITVENSEVREVAVQNVVTGNKDTLSVKNLFLCLGHSARDTFKLLKEKNVFMKQKPFAMGVRIEQEQLKINESQYGKDYSKCLPSADYKLVEHLDNGRSVFTFCMCPGGQVVASSSGSGEIVTNGMSDFKRDKKNANSAVLVNIETGDYESDDVLAGVEFQKKYERLAFKLGGGNYNAPCQTVGEFLGKKTKENISPSYTPGVTFCELKKCLPDFVSESLKLALPKLNAKLSGFALDENLLIGIESRSSCPLTIVRDENFESNVKGIYPVGEGAGYAGGIISSAVDGVKCAEAFYNRI